MQITFDTKHDTPADFKQASDWLASLSGQGAVIITGTPQPVHVQVTTGAASTEPSAAELFAGNAPPAAGASSVAGAAALANVPAVPQAGAVTPPPVTPPPVVNAAATGAPSGNAAPTTFANGVELDSRGLPWDARIHSLGANNTHPKTAKGEWKQKRGINGGNLVATVEAELRAVMAAGGGAAAAPAPAAVVPPPPVAGAAVVPPPPPVTATNTAPPPPVANGVCNTMPLLMTKITDAMGTGKLTQAQVLAAVQSVQLTELSHLTHRPDLIPQVAQYLDAVLVMA